MISYLINYKYYIILIIVTNYRIYTMKNYKKENKKEVKDKIVEKD